MKVSDLIDMLEEQQPDAEVKMIAVGDTRLAEKIQGVLHGASGTVFVVAEHIVMPDKEDD